MVFLAEDGGIGALGINLPSLIAQLINFTILLILVGWASKRFLFPLLDERRKRIQEGLDASEEAKQRLARAGAGPQRDTTGAGRGHRRPAAGVRRPHDYRRRAGDPPQPGPTGAPGAHRGGAGGGAPRPRRRGRPDVIREIAARRYGEGAVQIARDGGTEERWAGGLCLMAAIFSDAEVAAVMQEARISTADKTGLAAKALEGVDPLGLNLGRLLGNR